MEQAIRIEGSWDKTNKTCVTLPEIVLKFLRLKSAAKGKSMSDLILEAVKEYFQLKNAI